MEVSMSAETDVVVLGVGTCGEDLSLQLLDAGLDVVGIEAALVGGECPYWACLPTKRMLRAANLVADVARARGVAGPVEAAPDWGVLAGQVRAEVTGDRDDAMGVERFTNRGGTLVKGRGRLTGPRTVAVGDAEFTARRGIVIATGSGPFIPPVPGLDGVPFWTTHDLVATDVLPRSVTVLGGGAVGCELGQLIARFGARVTIIERAPGLLPGGEPEASAVLEDALAADGIDVRTGVAAVAVRADGDAAVVELDDGAGVTSERVLVATGRSVALGDLGLETAGIDPGSRFLEVDDHMRVADAIWAMGDVTGKGMFTHVALRQAATVAAGILGRPVTPVTYDAIPRVTFTDPEVASVGLTEAEAAAAGGSVVTALKRVPSTFRGWLHAVGNSGLIKLVADRDEGVLVGATVVGPSAGEVLGVLGLAVHARVRMDVLRDMTYAFPTFYGGIGEAIGAYGRGVTTVLDPGYDGLAGLDEVGAGAAP
jgi:pyruvate/2-oxoglutarate dehydrogenase complex dihydrolipoamide dehydrogenase (E3) component